MIKQIEINRKVSISNITLGMWGFSGGSWWKSYDRKEIKNVIKQAVACGITSIDTAPIYGFGECERILGELIKEYRLKIAVSTKCGVIYDKKTGTHFFTRDGFDVYKSLSRQSILHSVETSLKNLGIDSIDILYTHFQPEANSQDSIEEVMETLLELKDKGIIKAIGASNVTFSQLNRYMEYGGIDIIQEKYNLLDRKIEGDLLSYIKELELPLQIYSPLEMGVLTGKFSPDYSAAEGSARSSEASFKKHNIIRNNERIVACGFLCKKYKCSMGNLALAWLLKGYDKAILLCGASKAGQVAENVKAGNINLSIGDYRFMDQLFKGSGEGLNEIK